VLARYVHVNLADSHFAQATSWQAPVTPVDARISVDTLLMLRREFEDTEAAKKAPQAIADMFVAATKPYGEGKFCDSLTVLDYFAGLDPPSAGEKAVADANVFRARSLYELPVPPPIGGNEPGSIRVTFYNDSKNPVTVLVAGPTAHEFTIPACDNCPESYPKDDPPPART
jgi:hypothetical protein